MYVKSFFEFVKSQEPLITFKGVFYNLLAGSCSFPDKSHAVISGNIFIFLTETAINRNHEKDIGHHTSNWVLPCLDS